MATKVFLVSDTRLTTKCPDGTLKYEDTINKSFSLNERTSGIAAGYVNLAAFTISKIRENYSSESYIEDLRVFLLGHANEIIKEYVNTTGRHNESVAFIFAGYDPGHVKKINSSKLGNILSAPMVRRGNGSSMNQLVPKQVKQALAEAIITRGGLGPNEYIEADLPASRMISFELASKYIDGTNFFVLKEVECYDYTAFYPEQKFKSVVLPEEIISQIEFPQSGSIGDGSDAVVYHDARLLMGFVKGVATENKFENVGGNIFTLMVTSHGSIFPTGDVMMKNDEGKFEAMGVESINSVLYYKLPDGSSGPFKTIEGVAQDGKKSDMALV